MIQNLQGELGEPSRGTRKSELDLVEHVDVQFVD